MDCQCQFHGQPHAPHAPHRPQQGFQVWVGQGQARPGASRRATPERRQPSATLSATVGNARNGFCWLLLCRHSVGMTVFFCRQLPTVFVSK